MKEELGKEEEDEKEDMCEAKEGEDGNMIDDWESSASSEVWEDCLATIGGEDWPCPAASVSASGADNGGGGEGAVGEGGMCVNALYPSSLMVGMDELLFPIPSPFSPSSPATEASNKGLVTLTGSPSLLKDDVEGTAVAAAVAAAAAETADTSGTRRGRRLSIRTEMMRIL